MQVNSGKDERGGMEEEGIEETTLGGDGVGDVWIRSGKGVGLAAAATAESKPSFRAQSHYVGPCRPASTIR